LSQLSGQAAHYAFPAGLYDLPDDYTGIAAAKVRAKAMELYGEPGTEPATLRERQAILQQRGEELRDKLIANPIWKETVRAFAMNAPKVLPTWRVACLVSLLFALWGLLHQERTWDGWAVLTLSATLAVLLLLVLPVIIRFAAQLAVDVANFLRHAGTLLLLEYKQARLESQANAEQDLRRRLEQWVEEKMGLLLAEYQHNTNIALKARLAA
jgi:hypothetical protein